MQMTNPMCVGRHRQKKKRERRRVSRGRGKEKEIEEFIERMRLKERE